MDMCSSFDSCLLNAPQFTESAKVRLVNGNDRCSGRVEVYHSDQWRRVSSDDWDDMELDAEVVCRQLNCGSAVSAPVNAFLGQGSGMISMDDVDDESDLSVGSGYGFEGEDGEDAGVVCSASPVLVTVSGAAVGILLLLILVVIPCVVWRKRRNRQPSMTMSQRQCARCEDVDEEDYVITETIINKNRYDDLKTTYHAGMTAPGAMTRVGNNEAGSGAAEATYENLDSVTGMTTAVDMYGDESDYIVLEQLGSCNPREGNCYEDDNTYENCM
ncbi:antigen WC1.1 isoform X2 [Esox lucius]|uniref:antigen WC1.1 isoform X2 n=1 Tax=Esox lucius TaxID=8010 RepID=UPI00147769E9|nr:antigen WC1.1 isoform X2 [Esox lucius]